MLLQLRVLTSQSVDFPQSKPVVVGKEMPSHPSVVDNFIM
jgi:hypothetical protein